MTGEEIKRARERLKLKQSELAAMLGLTVTWLSRVEGGSREVAWYVPVVLAQLARCREMVPDVLARALAAKPSRLANVPQFVVTMIVLAKHDRTGPAWLLSRLSKEPATVVSVVPGRKNPRGKDDGKRQSGPGRPKATAERPGRQG